MNRTGEGQVRAKNRNKDDEDEASALQKDGAAYKCVRFHYSPDEFLNLNLPVNLIRFRQRELGAWRLATG